MNIQESDSTVSYYSHNDVVKTALVWIDTETNKLYIRTTEGFSPLERLKGIIRNGDGSPKFDKLPQPAPDTRPKSFAEAQALAQKQHCEALAARNRQRLAANTTELSPELQARSEAARAQRNATASARTDSNRTKPTGITPEGPQKS